MNALEFIELNNIVVEGTRTTNPLNLIVTQEKEMKFIIDKYGVKAIKYNGKSEMIGSREYRWEKQAPKETKKSKDKLSYRKRKMRRRK